MDLLDSPVRHYAWGSRTAIAEVQGRAAPTPEPEAELWMGAHDGAPSMLVRDGRQLSLAEVVAADPEAELGPAAVSAHGPRLPFLLKLLAADEPLSIQAHPDADHARAGFAAEEAAGIRAGDAARNYVDPHHKPELLYAVTEFEALCGFRDPAATARLLARIDAPLLDDYTAELVARPDAAGLRSVVTRVLTLAGPERVDLVAEVVAGCRGLSGRPYELTVDLGGRYPGDAGAVIALLLNDVHLRPGETIFLPPGNLHAYLRGVGIELMASSDNVLRGGLTPKRVDVGELLRVARFDPGAVLPLRPSIDGDGVFTWRPPVADFALHRILLDGTVRLPADGPRILFCLAGRADADDGTGEVALRAGQSRSCQPVDP